MSHSLFFDSGTSSEAACVDARHLMPSPGAADHAVAVRLDARERALVPSDAFPEEREEAVLSSAKISCRLKRPSPRLRVLRPLSLHVASSSARWPHVVLPSRPRPASADAAVASSSASSSASSPPPRSGGGRSCFCRFLHVWKEVGVSQSMLDIVCGFVILLLSLSRPRRPSPTSRVRIT